MAGVRIAGIGMALPPNIITNDDIVRELFQQREKVLAQGISLSPEQLEEYETSDEWITERTGVKERRRSNPNETTSDYTMRAMADAWTDAYGDGLEIPEFFLSASVLGDFPVTPATNVIASRKSSIPVYLRPDPNPDQSLLRHFVGADVTQACASFMAALLLASALVKSGECKRGIVCGADLMFRTMSRNKRSPYVILGEGAGAYVLEATSDEETWISPRAFLSGVNGGVDGKYEDLIKTHAGGATVPITPEHLDPRCDNHLMCMDGNAVFKLVVPLLADKIIPSALARAGLTLKDIDVFIPHQANYRITEAAIHRMLKANLDVAFSIATFNNPVGDIITLKGESGPRTGMHTIVCYSNIDRFGNMTSASIPVATKEAVELGIITPGKVVLEVAFGGGISWCSVIIHWGGINHPAFRKAVT